MKSREQIINDMCMTWRHDYGLELSEDDRMYTLSSGMTKHEREALWRNMAQIFDNDIAPLLESHKHIKEGTHIPIPANVEQAKGMILVAENYLKHHQ
jgi:hypothetical protein